MSDRDYYKLETRYLGNDTVAGWKLLEFSRRGPNNGHYRTSMGKRRSIIWTASPRSFCTAEGVYIKRASVAGPLDYNHHAIDYYAAHYNYHLILVISLEAHGSLH
jgi:hypothetical protein